MQDKPPPQTAAQRQAKYREHLAQQEKTTITVAVTSDTAKRLRNLSRDYRRPMGTVIDLGVWAALRELEALEASKADSQ